MFDHVEIAVSELAASERFYRAVLSVLGVEPTHADAELVDWGHWGIVPADDEHPVTRGLHVGFRAPSREAVDSFRQAGIDAGHARDGLLLDPDRNSVEAVHDVRERPVPGGHVDHVCLRVADPAASKRFQLAVAPYTGMRLAADEPELVRFDGDGHSITFLRDERPATTRFHLAYGAGDDATVRAFHAAALAAGYEDHGAPGERPAYHASYYGAFVLDPDGHNVEVVNHNR
jgi:catechol 2,3-dioxygenase-like lactoylglutathione lyase family enzyme